MIEKFLEIGTNISTPLALAGLVFTILFFVLRRLLSSGLLKQVSQKSSGEIITLVIDRLFALSLIAMILGFIGFLLSNFLFPIENKNIANNENYRRMLLGSSQELRSNREFVMALRAYIDDDIQKRPIGVVSSEKTIELLDYYYNETTRFAYGEEKYVYQLALQLNAIGKELAKFRTRNEFKRWNEHYEMTIDDVSFLCGFIFWYIAHVAQEDLKGNAAYALGWHPLSGSFATPQEIDKLNMRFFLDNGKPIIEYGNYLGLID